MSDPYPYSIQRERLLVFADALNSSPSALRRDDGGDPCINGRYGRVYAVHGIDWIKPVTEGFQLYCMCDTKRAWTAAKKSLSFAVVTQDGDEEGYLFLGRRPTPDEAEVVRAYLGIRKRAEYTEESLARKRAQALSMVGARAEKPASDEEKGE